MERKTSAFVLINVELGSSVKVEEYIRSFGEVKSVHSTYGAYDLIVELDCDDADKQSYLIQNIRQYPKIRSTMTMVTVNKRIVDAQ